MDEGERDHLLSVLAEIINLKPGELEELERILQTTKLSGVIRTIKLIEDRIRAVADIRRIVFDRELYVTEPKHVQKMIENHYWLFGEQYHLVVAAERKFDEALRRHTHILRGEQTSGKVNHPDKNKEMDLFLVRQLPVGRENSMSNVVVELKNPDIKLGKKELDQVKTYMDVILSTPEFNASNMMWDFYLVGNEFDHTGAIRREIENSRLHGEPSLAFSVDNYRIYVKTWSEIFADFELKHNFLMEQLRTERDQLAIQDDNADQIVNRQNLNTASMLTLKVANRQKTS